MSPPLKLARCSEVIVRFIRQDLIDDQGLAALPRMEIAFVGARDLDDRSEHSVARSSQLAGRCYTVRYDSKAYTLHVGNKSFQANEGGLEDLALHFNATSVVIDATTLDFAEIALLLYAYQFTVRKPRVGFLYVEPQEYVRRSPDDASVNGAAFDLSDGFTTQSIPVYSTVLGIQHRAHLVAFLGFEGSRLAWTLASDDGHFVRKTSVIFGIPPFQATWDLEAFMANSRLLSNQELAVKFCGANNPKAAYELLCREQAAITTTSECNRLIVAPFGTKPMAIGAALYCSGRKLSRVVFDHPKRKKGRTRGVHCTHWYEVQLS
ncbi:hypothetical protein [Pseudomonas aeruginosa]|uniref:hypothetical protein n=1 Tax=Pseudomonas aeruginosa TaxID=287 RepID=UPI0018E2DE89|nr:hypothetical protein [Pseudomonas aeruginosa]MBX5700364.1 hypothetical protein [Pseudomonas aeruginosa]MDU0680294.1 hypothetical protein [Pseudomonas aeruginosa]QQD35952.1 hypothetical protein HUF09_29060 [Pseudomonas aeruginosa]UJB87448.1 hypothetical protein HUK64_19130 [Pseudomonas aeruginosa]UJB95575.1 hypothetical protein HUK67_30630 [Pseudomonas aeruginosa]